jgi:uncharacterized Zn-finger protein
MHLPPSLRRALLRSIVQAFPRVWKTAPRTAIEAGMSNPPETVYVAGHRVQCDGATDIAPALGHPRVWLQIDEAEGFIDCGYCDRRFVLKGGAADQAAA